MSFDVCAEVVALASAKDALAVSVSEKRGQLDTVVGEARAEADRAQYAADQAAVFAGMAGPFGGIMHLANGSAAAPSLTLGAENTSGIFRDGDGWIGFAINGSGTIYVAHTEAPFVGNKAGTGLEILPGGAALVAENVQAILAGPSGVQINLAVTGNAVIQGEADATAGRLLTTAAVIPINRGGTGKKTAQEGREALGAAPTADPIFTGAATAPRVRITSTTDASLTSTAHGLQIGPDNGQALVFDNNEIISRIGAGDGSFTAAALVINPDGGTVTIGGVLTIAATALTFDGFPVARLFTGSVQTTVDFPIGHTVAVLAPGNTNRNGTATIRLSTANMQEYTTEGTGDTLTGTWRSRGRIATGVYLFERVS